MKYIARDESPVANIARGKASAIFFMRLSSRAAYFYTNKVAVFQVFYCILYLVKYQQNTVPW